MTLKPKWTSESVGEYERGLIEGRQIQMQSSVDKAVNAMSRPWVGLTDAEVENLCLSLGTEPIEVRFIEAKLKEKNA